MLDLAPGVGFEPTRPFEHRLSRLELLLRVLYLLPTRFPEFLGYKLPRTPRHTFVSGFFLSPYLEFSGKKQPLNPFFRKSLYLIFWYPHWGYGPRRGARDLG